MGARLAGGAALTVAVAPLLRAVLFGVGAFDLPALAAAVAALALVTPAAVIVPVRHALSVGAIDAMRSD